MNPTKFQDEIDYYVTLLEKYEENIEKGSMDLDTFICREIIEIMRELKVEKINIPLMEDITKNSLLILLSFYHEQRKQEYFQHFKDLDEKDKQTVRNRFIPLLS